MERDLRGTTVNGANFLSSRHVGPHHNTFLHQFLRGRNLVQRPAIVRAMLEQVWRWIGLLEDYIILGYAATTNNLYCDSSQVDYNHNIFIYITYTKKYFSEEERI